MQRRYSEARSLLMFGFRFWQALFEGKRWARRQLVEAVVVLVVCGVVVGIHQAA